MEIFKSQIFQIDIKKRKFRKKEKLPKSKYFEGKKLKKEKKRVQQNVLKELHKKLQSYLEKVKGGSVKIGKSN